LILEMSSDRNVQQYPLHLKVLQPTRAYLCYRIKH
uniref:UTRA domain-containing protein n=1 Tax=Brugia timori TaxID=42155 RepID=A0A0R3QXF0_9BILA